MSHRYPPLDEIKRLPTNIGINQFEGQAAWREDERRETKWRPWTQSPSSIRRLIGRIAISLRLG